MAVGAVEDDLVADANRAGVRLLEPRNRAQQRRLAAARGAEQRHDFAPLQRERDALQDRVVAIGQADVFDSELGHGSHSVVQSRKRTPKRSASARPMPTSTTLINDSAATTSIAPPCHSETSCAPMTSVPGARR